MVKLGGSGIKHYPLVKHTKSDLKLSRLVYRDDAEGDWASRCRRDENTSRRQAINFNRFESHTQHLSNEDESGRPKPDL